MDYYNIVHGILQARILQWVTFPFSKGPSQPRDQSQVSHTAGRFFTSWATKEALKFILGEALSYLKEEKFLQQRNRKGKAKVCVCAGGGEENSIWK